MTTLSRIQLACYDKVSSEYENPELNVYGVYDIESDPNHIVERWCNGQDHMIHIKLSGEDRLLGIFDGHGPKGHYFSYIASSILVNLILLNWEKFKEYVENKEEIAKMLGDMYVETQNKLIELEETQLTDDSGTCVSIAQILTVNDERYIINSNLGDSPIIWSENSDTYEECILEDNCDSFKAVQHYLDRIKSLRDKTGDTKYQPKSVYFGRINCVDGPKWDYQCKGGSPPLKVFNYIEDKAYLISKNYNLLAKYYPLGSQSLRYPPTFINSKGDREVQLGHEQENFGNTLEGESQILSSLGDIKSSFHTSQTPHIKIKKIEKSGILLLASDGLTDLFSYQKLTKLLWKGTNDIMKEIGEINKIDGQYETFVFNEKKYAKWDDTSGLFLRIESLLKK